MNLPFFHKTCLPQYLYFHYPLCQHVCSYCDFNAFSVARIKKDHPDFEARWLASLQAQLSRWWQGEPKTDLQTLYLGGGTPSLLGAKSLRQLLDFLNTQYDFSTLREFTIECNPETVSLAYWTTIKKLGVTRPSLGIQSLRPEHLRRLERLATYDHIESAVKGLGDHFDNYSLDFMIGIPDQTLEHVREDLEKIIAWEPPHLSIYILTIEPDHIWHRQPFINQRLAKSEEVAAMYEDVCMRLKNAGYVHYEVSNFAKPGFESIHNKNYWQAESDYFGAGPGAHGYLRSKDGSIGRIRYACHGGLNEWMTSETGVNWFEELTAEQQRIESLYLRLRTRVPVKAEELKTEFTRAYLNEGLVQRDATGTIVVTEKGWLVLEELAAHLI